MWPSPGFQKGIFFHLYLYHLPWVTSIPWWFVRVAWLVSCTEFWYSYCYILSSHSNKCHNIKQVPLLNNPPPLHQALLSPLPSPEVTFLNSRDTRKTCFYFHLIDERINNDSNAIINMQTNTCACVKCVMSLWQKCWINIYKDDVVLSCFSIKNLAKIKLQFIEKKT